MEMFWPYLKAFLVGGLLCLIGQVRFGILKILLVHRAQVQLLAAQVKKGPQDRLYHVHVLKHRSRELQILIQYLLNIYLIFTCNFLDTKDSKNIKLESLKRH